MTTWTVFSPGPVESQADALFQSGHPLPCRTVATARGEGVPVQRLTRVLVPLFVELSEVKRADRVASLGGPRVPLGRFQQRRTVDGAWLGALHPGPNPALSDCPSRFIEGVCPAVAAAR